MTDTLAGRCAVDRRLRWDWQGIARGLADEGVGLFLSVCLDGALGGCPTVSVALAPIPTDRQPQNGIPVSGKTPL